MTRTSTWLRLAATLFACLTAVATSIVPPGYVRLDARVDSRVFSEGGLAVYLHEPPSTWKLQGATEELSNWAEFSFVVKNERSEDVVVSTRDAELEWAGRKIAVVHGTERTLRPGESLRFAVHFACDEIALPSDVQGYRWPNRKVTPSDTVGRVRLATFRTPAGAEIHLDRDAVLAWGLPR